MLCATLDAAGLDGYRVGLGDASLFPRALERRRRATTRGPILHELASRDMVGLERELEAAGAPELLDLAAARGGVEESCPRASRCASLRAAGAATSPSA